MRHYFIALTVFILTFGLKPKETFNFNKVELPLKQFQLYTFQLVEKEELNKMIFTNGKEKDDDDLIWEELYLLIDKKNKNAIYFTTRSHKYIFKGGVYNRPENNKLIFLDEVEFVFLGKIEGNYLIFNNTGNSEADDLEINYEFQGNDILLKDINLDRSNSPVDIKSLFSTELIFQKDSRQFAFGRKKIKPNYEYDYFEKLETIYTDFKYLYGLKSCTKKEVLIHAINNHDIITFERFKKTYLK